MTNIILLTHIIEDFAPFTIYPRTTPLIYWHIAEVLGEEVPFPTSPPRYIPWCFDGM